MVYAELRGFRWLRLDEPAAGKDFNPGHVTTMDMWSFIESQETKMISEDMFTEFAFSYQFEIAKQFGMNYYGCCEPINGRWNIVKQIPNLRRVSASPWADLNPMAEMSGKDAGRAARWCRIAREELLG